jgi:hypothetical protein
MLCALRSAPSISHEFRDVWPVVSAETVGRHEQSVILPGASMPGPGVIATMRRCWSRNATFRTSDAGPMSPQMHRPPRQEAVSRTAGGTAHTHASEPFSETALRTMNLRRGSRARMTPKNSFNRHLWKSVVKPLNSTLENSL